MRGKAIGAKAIVTSDKHSNSSRVTRRTALKLVPGILACAAYTERSPLAHAEDAKNNGGLAALAAERGILFGSAMTVHELAPAYADLFITETAIITPENEMKMASVRKSQDAPDFARADQIVAFAEAQGKRLRGHNLVWTSQVPDWIKTMSKPEMERFLDEHIDLMMGRYEGRIYCWDVVNEPIGHQPYGNLTLREGIFPEIVGPDYIARSFRRARAADSNAKLILNETHTERDDGFGHDYRKRLLILIDSLLDAGVPLDGIGLEGHIQPDVKFLPETYAEFLQAISDRGLEIQITELDVNDQSFPDNVEERDSMVADVYTRFLTTVLSNPKVKLVATWQMTDRTAYYYNESLGNSPDADRRPRPLLFDLEFNRKPSYYAVAKAFMNTSTRA
jgi:endo-1,4-beta-xylanase